MAFEFDFAISYASEDREAAFAIAESLQDGGFSVFFAPVFEAALWGRDLRITFEEYYGSNTRFVIPIISINYVNKNITRYELNMAQREAASRRHEFILPVRLDDTLFPGLHPDIGYRDYRVDGCERVVALLREKYDLIYGTCEEEGLPSFWCATYGVNAISLLESRELPDEAPRDYPLLCDWLEYDILNKFRTFGLTNYDFSEPSLRTGETLSVRIIFRLPDPERIPPIQNIGFWELLELLPAIEVYPGQSPDELLETR